MYKTKKHNTEHLLRWFTEDVAYDDRGASFAYNHSIKNLLIEKGKEAIPDIGKYLEKIDEVKFSSNGEPDLKQAKECWISLLLELVAKEEIAVLKPVTSFEEWVEWAKEYKPIKESKVNESLMDLVTDDLINEDLSVEHAFNHSRNIKKLIEKGPIMIPIIATYMKKKKNSIEESCGDDEKGIFRHGWVMILCDIVHKAKINMRVIIGGNYSDWDDYDRWAHWAHEFKL